LVLSVGHNVDETKLEPTAPDALIVQAAPQPELLQRAVLCITHAGLNTTLESLSQGMPLVAIPISFDQPGVAARIGYHQAGDFLELGELAVERPSEPVGRVLRDLLYDASARRLQQIIAGLRGFDLATEIL
jgi:zeaxanthin glucosyltransferase